MLETFRFFLPSLIISAIALGAIFVYGGLTAFIIAVLLSILEVTLSFDNAVINARVLNRMSPVWQRRFLTWGILIAVFGTRLVLPILIVSLIVWVSPIAITKLALFHAEEYAHLLENARYAINSFGAIFLIMVSLKYFMDESKDKHWLRVIERHLAKWGRIESIEIAIALTLLAGISFLVPDEVAATVLISGIIGLILFLIMQGITSSFSITTTVAASGLALFIYLNILDSAFSLDSVVGAFALSTSIPIIAVGLGIGAYFVRSITVFLVQKKALDSIIYLEHGAHWAVFGLAISMLAGLLVEVPEIITGGIGLLFVVAAYYSSAAIRGQKES